MSRWDPSGIGLNAEQWERMAEAVRKLGTSANSLVDQFSPLGRKRITDVVLDTRSESIDVSTFGSPYPKHITTQSTEWVDQDNEPLPPELARILNAALESPASGERGIGEAELRKILGDWNDGPLPTDVPQRTPGHKSNCIYVGSSHFACTCHPATIFGPVLLWHCECCERPRAPEQYGLCEMCREHQYSDTYMVKADHEADELA